MSNNDNKRTYVPSAETFTVTCMCGRTLFVDPEGVILHQMPICNEFLRDQPVDVYLRKVRQHNTN